MTATMPKPTPLKKRPFRIGDQVEVISGKSKGQKGKIQRIDVQRHSVLIEGVNLCKKHSKPRSEAEKGGIFSIEAPLHISNVKVLRKN